MFIVLIDILSNISDNNLFDFTIHNIKHLLEKKPTICKCKKCSFGLWGYFLQRNLLLYMSKK